ncbi:MAG: DUF4340 domain-containing protein [Elusimicrobiota bacterium]
MVKRFSVLGAVLLALCLLIIFFLNRNLAAPQSHPLSKIKRDAITGIDIQGPQGHIVIQKSGGVWRMISPVQDLADASACAELLKNLSGMSVGSEVSRDPESYDDYEIGKSSAVRVALSGGNPSKTVFDAYFGKTAMGFDSIYLRWADRKPVYLAEGVSRYLSAKTSDDYRSRLVFSLAPDKTREVRIRIGAREYDIAKSSAGWVFEKPKASAQKASSIADDLFSLRAAGFPPENKPSPKMGFLRPLLTAAIIGENGGRETIAVGRAQRVGKNQKPFDDYAQISGRTAPILLAVYDVNALLRALVSR